VWLLQGLLTVTQQEGPSNQQAATVNPEWLVQRQLSKEDALVRSKWRRLIRGTDEDSDDSWG